MFDHYEGTLALEKFRREDMMRQAENYRLARIAKGMTRSARFYAPALAYTGMLLARLGNGLHERYGEIAASGEPVTKPVSRTQMSC